VGCVGNLVCESAIEYELLLLVIFSLLRGGLLIIGGLFPGGDLDGVSLFLELGSVDSLV